MTTDMFEAPCLCLARDALQTEPEQYKWCGGTLWAIYRECPSHAGERFKSPVWAQRIGRLREEQSASGELAPVERT